ncbi:ribbon-helix-helix domain-containing protein [uncultured Sneathiella sp.]|uniref:ribbon-helix-helix domain-containing protein n=1 Tax=uncultured Sneathiella sp. TaxID=879315 RepID=UPI0030DDDC9B|tara:strand:+ start:320 stop:478 length:159 start_codon:yes stop_codon:yes gene_type:complete
MSKTTYNQPFGLRFPPQLAKRLQERAEREEMTLSEIVRQATRQYLDTMEKAA